MDAYKCITRRVCTREFSSKKVPIKLIYKILETARQAPSAKNRQPWKFVIIKDNKIKRKICMLAFKARERQYSNLTKNKFEVISRKRTYLSSNDKSILEAPFSIIVCYDKSRSRGIKESSKEFLKLKDEQGIAAATQNILLASYSLGLSSCWNCSVLYIQKELQNLLKLSKNIEPRVIIPIGYSKIKSIKPSRISLKEIISII